MKRIAFLTALAAIIAAWCAGPVWAAHKFVEITDLHVVSSTGEGNGVDPNGAGFSKMVTYIIGSINPSYVLVSGDMVNGSSDANYDALTRSLIYQNNTWYLKKTDGTSSGIPIYFAPGNHDSRTSLITTDGLAKYDAKIKYLAATPPRKPGSSATCSFGSGAAAHDYFFTCGNALVFSMYAGWQKTVTGWWEWPEADGFDPAQMTRFYQVLKDSSAKYANKIVFMHNPAVNTIGNPLDGALTQNRTAFLDTCAKYGVTVLSGHTHQNKLLQRDGSDWSSGAKYVQTGAGVSGVYRIIQVNDNGTVTVGNAQRYTGVVPKPTITSPQDGSYIYNGNKYSIKVSYDAGSTGVTKVEFYVDGAKAGEKTAEPYVWDYTVPAKAVNCKIQAKSYDNLGGINTSTINVTKGASTFYNTRYVSDPVFYITDPKDNVSKVCKLYSVGSGYAAVQINGDVQSINVGEMRRFTNTNLIAYVAAVSVAGNWSQFMIAPYQYPSLDILRPVPNEITNNSIVYVATNYSGKNVPWQGTGSAPTNTELLKSLTFGSSPAQSSETYAWIMSGGAGQRTLTVTMTDKMTPPTTITKSVTVTYDPTKPFYAYNGPYGDAYNGFTIGTSYYDYARVSSYVWFWRQEVGEDISYPSGVRCQGIQLSRDEAIAFLTSSIANAVTRSGGPSNGGFCCLPSGCTTVFVVDKNLYNSTTPINLSPHGTVTYKEVFDKAALAIGKDNQGRYRVWASASAISRSPADAIDPEPPSIAWGFPSSGSTVTTSPFTCTVNSVMDNVGVTQVRFYNITNGFQWTAGTQDAYSPTTWYASVPLVPGNNELVAVAFDAAGNSTQAPPSGSPAITVTYNATVFSDGFENYTSGSTIIGQNGWTNGYGTNNGNMVVVSDQHSQGSKSLRGTSNNTSRQDAEHTFAGITDFICEFDMRTDKSLTATYDWVFFNLNDGAKQITTVGFGRQYDGLGNQIVVQNGSTYRALQTYARNTWYNVKIIGNFSTKKVDVLINGVSKVTGQAFVDASAASFNKIGFDVYNYGSSVNAWIDNLVISRTKGAFESALTGEAKPLLPAATRLVSLAPNPLIRQATISYQIATPANVSLNIYNISGQLVKTLVSDYKPAGYHSVKWDGSDANGSKIAAGLYLYRMEAGDYTKTNKMTVLR